MRAGRRWLLPAVLMLVAAEPSWAQQCKSEDVFAVIDATGQRLREINAEWQPRQRDKLKELAAEFEADAIVGLGFEVDGVQATDLAPVSLSRVNATGVAVKLARR